MDIQAYADPAGLPASEAARIARLLDYRRTRRCERRTACATGLGWIASPRRCGLGRGAWAEPGNRPVVPEATAGGYARPGSLYQGNSRETLRGRTRRRFAVGARLHRPADGKQSTHRSEAAASPAGRATLRHGGSSSAGERKRSSTSFRRAEAGICTLMTPRTLRRRCGQPHRRSRRTSFLCGARKALKRTSQRWHDSRRRSDLCLREIWFNFVGKSWCTGMEHCRQTSISSRCLTSSPRGQATRS